MFKENNYSVIKGVIDKKLAFFLYNYLLIKNNVARTLFKTNYIAPHETMHGVFNDLQVPGSFAIYADVAMETLLAGIHPVMEAHTKLKLYPTYSYARVYSKGNVLKRHKDRFSCEISTTMNLGGDVWPIYMQPDKTQGTRDKNDKYIPSKSKGIKVILNPGDMLIYRGSLLEHWRNKFKGNTCVQVFLHYNKKTKKGKDNLYDGRQHLGLPTSFNSLVHEGKNKK
tara:strand:+ start:1075 stop:1749 length:675 start_codon:yes stop_codon:yes gene_type:complete